MKRKEKKKRPKFSTLKVLNRIETQGSLNHKIHYQVSRLKKRGYLDKYGGLTDKARKLLKTHLVGYQACYC